MNESSYQRFWHPAAVTEVDAAAVGCERVQQPIHRAPGA